MLLSTMSLASCFTFELENFGRQDLNDNVFRLNDPIDSTYNWTVRMEPLTLEVEQGKAFAGLYRVTANCSSQNENTSCRSVALFPIVVKDTCADVMSAKKARSVIYGPYVRACHGDTISVSLNKVVTVSMSLGEKTKKTSGDGKEDKTIPKAKSKNDVHIEFLKWLEGDVVRSSGSMKNPKAPKQFVTAVHDEEEEDEFDD